MLHPASKLAGCGADQILVVIEEIGVGDSTKHKGKPTRESADDDAAPAQIFDAKPRGLWQQLDGRVPEPTANRPRGMWEWTNARANEAREESQQPSETNEIAERGVASARSELPFRDQIQSAFGPHDVSGIRAQVGGPAAEASRSLGARAYATGNRVGFAEAPDLHTAAHEAAHVVQQTSGISLKNIDGGASDAHERHADAVADAVVRGESAAPLLAGIAGSGIATASAGSVQRKTGPTNEGPGVPDTSASLQISTERSIPLGAVTGTLGMAVVLSKKGTLRGKVGGADVSIGDRATNLKLTDQFTAGIQTTLASAKERLLAGELPAPWGHMPLSVTFEIKGLQAGLSLKKIDLKLMSASIVITGDFSGVFPPDVREHIQAQGKITISVPLDPDLAKQLIELAQASDDVKRGAEFETKVARTEDELSHWQRLKTSAAEIEKLEPSVANLRRAAPSEIRRLEAELDKLRGLRGKVSDLRRRALVKIEQIGLKLEQRAGGRLLMKVGTEALSFVFKKFLPIYNAVSTARDLFEAGRYLAGLDWSSIGRTIVDGSNVQGTTFGDGSKHDEGTGVPGQAASEADDIGNAEQIQSELESHEHVKLHPAAEAALATLAAGHSDKPTTPISDHDREQINAIVPKDLTNDEITDMQRALSERMKGAAQQDIVEAVIAVVEETRPNGQRQERDSRPEQGPKDDSRTSAAGAKGGHGGKAPKKLTVNPTSRVQHSILVSDTKTLPIKPSNLHWPASIEFDGVTAALTDVVAVPFDDNGRYSVRVRLRVTAVPANTIVEFEDRTPVHVGTERTVVFFDEMLDEAHTIRPDNSATKSK